MYALELQIWGMKESVDSEIAQREELKRKANMLFVEINKMVGDWNSMGDEYWSPDELAQIEEIRNVLRSHDLMRFRPENGHR